MPIPEVLITVLDGQINILPENTDKVQVKIGTCSKGTVNVLYSIASRSILVDTFEAGPLVECAALALANGAGPILCMRVSTANPVPITPIIISSGTNPLLVSLGTTVPRDAWSGIIRIVEAGTLGTATFQFSLDGGASYSGPYMTAATYEMMLHSSVSTGLTIAFPAGSYSADNVYTFTSTAPLWDATALDAALEALRSDPTEWGIVHVIGECPSAVLTNTHLQAMQTKLNDFALNSFRYVRGIIDGFSGDDYAVRIACQSTNADRVAVSIGKGTWSSILSGRKFSRPVSWVSTAQLPLKALGADPAQIFKESGTGPLPFISILHRDETSATVPLNSRRFTTYRTLIGKTGFFVTNFNLFSTPGSDYEYLQHGQVVDSACKLIRGAMLEYLSRKLKVSPAGTLKASEAMTINANLMSILNAGIIATGECNAAYVQVNQTDIVLQTKRLRCRVGVQPLFYPKFIEVEIGFTLTIPVINL